MDVFQFLECASCGETCSRKDSMIRHIQQRHWIVKPFECDSCGEKFSRKDGLIRHIQRKHWLLKPFECSSCGKKYRRKHHFLYHFKTHQDQDTIFECASCSKTFYNRKKLVVHIRGSHPDPQKPFVCCRCNGTFHFKGRLVKHMRHCRNYPKNPKKSISDVNRFKCQRCYQVFATKVLIKQHYCNVHNIKLEIQTLELKSFEEFKEWKSNTQQLNISQFINQVSSESKTYHTKVFVCHRSSINRTHSRKKTDEKFPKQVGSKKLNTYCPAEMVVRISKVDGSCIVNYTSTHIGHPVNDLNELKHVYLTEKERLHVAARLKDSVPRPDVQKQELLSKRKVTGSCLNILRSLGIRNVSESYIIDERTFKNNDIEMDIFVENNKESVLFYKDQSTEDFQFGVLKKNDFVLVLMNKTQEKYIQRFAENVVCFDGTYYGTNKYEFLLHTLLVMDVDREGYPAAFLITNCNDSIVIDVFLACIKERVGDIRTRVLMTDMQTSYYNSWISVMDTAPEFYFHCTWHVNDAWRKNYSKMSNKVIAQEVKRHLHSLWYELNPLQFDQKLAAFLAIEDKGVENFIEYFRQYCAQEPHLWAYCHRYHAGVNVNMALESFHKQIKCKLTNGKNLNWLSHTLKLIKEYLELRSVEEEIKNIREGDYPKRKKLRRQHHEARRNCKDNDIEELVFVIDSNTFVVQSFTDEDILYVVTKQPGPKECTLYDDVTCGLVCQLCEICFHEYTCNCLQNTIHSSMCKHIHSVGIFNQKNKSLVDVTESVPVVISDLYVEEEQLIEQNIISLAKTESENEHEDVVYEKMKMEALELVADSLDEARVHGINFVRNCIEQYLVPMKLASDEAQRAIKVKA